MFKTIFKNELTPVRYLYWDASESSNFSLSSAESPANTQ